MIGGGSLPEESLPSCALAFTAAPHLLAQRLRTGEPAVVARVQDARLILDPRTVDPADDTALVRAVAAALDA